MLAAAQPYCWLLWAAIQPWPHSIHVWMGCSKQGRQLCSTANFLPCRSVSDSWVTSPPEQHLCDHF